MVNEVKIKMTADDLASGKIKDVGNSAESTADKFRNMRGTFLAMGAAGTAITGVLALFTKSALEQQIGINLLDNSLKNVGTSYEAEKEAIEGVIGALQDKTNFGDEEQRESLSTLIALTGDYEISLKALAVITDMATAMDMDFKNASILVAKALAGQTSSLTRYGIQIDSSATKTEILASLTEKFGGAAEAARNPMTQLGNRTGDVSQAMGDVLLPIVESLLPALEGLAESTVEFMENNKGLTAAVVILAGALGALLIVGGTVGLLIPTIAFAYGGLTTAVTAAAAAKALFTASLWANVAAWIAFHAATGGIFLAIAAAIAGVVLGAIWLVKNIDKVKDAFRNLYNKAVPHINNYRYIQEELAKNVNSSLKNVAIADLLGLGYNNSGTGSIAASIDGYGVVKINTYVQQNLLKHLEKNGISQENYDFIIENFDSIARGFEWTATGIVDNQATRTLVLSTLPNLMDTNVKLKDNERAINQEIYYHDAESLPGVSIPEGALKVLDDIDNLNKGY